jgi:hypothetical protein
MVKNRRAMIALALLAAVAVWLLFFRGEDAPVAGSAPSASRAPQVEEVPWINLDRLKAENPEVALGRRNIFSFGAAPPPPTPVPTEGPEDGVPPPTMPDTPPPTPPPPAIALKFMGVVNVKNRPRIAVLLTEQKEILHGREGDVVAGRYKIVQIGLESVKVQEVVSGHEQTIRIGGH